MASICASTRRSRPVSTLALTAVDEPDKTITVAIPLTGVVEEFFTKEIDGQGSRLLAVRTPGDQLLVSFDPRCAALYAGRNLPGSSSSRINSRFPDGAKAKLKAQLFPAAGGKELWSVQQDLHAGKTRRDSAGSRFARRRGRVRCHPYRGQQPRLVAGGAASAAMEQDARRAADPTVGASIPAALPQAPAATARGARCWRSIRRIRTGGKSKASSRSCNSSGNCKCRG